MPDNEKEEIVSDDLNIIEDMSEDEYDALNDDEKAEIDLAWLKAINQNYSDVISLI